MYIHIYIYIIYIYIYIYIYNVRNVRLGHAIRVASQKHDFCKDYVQDLTVWIVWCRVGICD